MIVFLIICELSDSLDPYLNLGHVWLIDVGKYANKAQAARAQSPRNQVTTFRARPMGDETEIDSYLSSIYEHHPDWTEIRVVRSA